MTDAERARGDFVQCLTLASAQYGISTSPQDTIAAAIAYLNAMNSVSDQCRGDRVDKADGIGAEAALRFNGITGMRL